MIYWRFRIPGRCSWAVFSVMRFFRCYSLWSFNVAIITATVTIINIRRKKRAKERGRNSKEEKKRKRRRIITRKRTNHPARMYPNPRHISATLPPTFLLSPLPSYALFHYHIFAFLVVLLRRTRHILRL